MPEDIKDAVRVLVNQGIGFAKDLEFLRQTMVRLDKYMTDTEKENKKTFVTQDQFKPVKALTYGFTGLALTTIVLAMIGSVITK